jgi:hypothetical protein
MYHSGKIPDEIDFEIGSGTIVDRKRLKAKTNEAIVHCTSQYAPHASEIFKASAEQWHTFTLVLTENNNRYLVRWYINKVLVKTLQTKISTSHQFSVQNSLENLPFIGEQLPAKKNYVMFDSFTFQ